MEGGAITSHQLSLQPGTANRKVSNVAAGEKIREKNPQNSKAIFGGKCSYQLCFLNHFWQYQIIRVVQSKCNHLYFFLVDRG